MDPRARFAALTRRRDAEIPLAETALWIAAEEYPGLDVARWLRRVDALGDAARARLTRRMEADQAAAALNRLLFEEEGFRGNTENYYDPRNSFLNDVLERRLGIPITLSVVYMEVAARAGVRVRGIGLPGHFVVRLDRADGSRLLDPFDGGRLLTEADCRLLVQRVHGADARVDPADLRPVTARHILRRMLGNLKGVYQSRGDWLRALLAVDRILVLEPDAVGELRDRGSLHWHLGRPQAAIRDWETYLTRVPHAADAARVREELRALRQALAILN